MQRADHPHVGVILDTFHALARKCPVEPIAAIPPERIVLVQTADAPAIDMDLLFLSRHYRSFPGQGELPVVSMMQQLAQIGYRGWVSHEIFSDDFRASSPRQTAIDGMRSFRWLDEQLGLGPSPSPVPKVEGIEFLEFVDEPGSAAPFRAMLKALGFRRTHRHRSKDVELHSQGDIRIVLNLEDEGFAHSFQLLHGLSVAAIALRVDDATAAVDRADSLLGKHFRGPIGQGELELPAVRGVGGSLLYFIDQKLGPAAFQEVDFLPDPEGPLAPDLGLTTIDHLAQVVPQTEFLSWLLYYRAILGLEPDARTDLNDPRGLIVSRALTNPARTLRLPLNASQAQASAAGRFMERTAGAGAQHIAFACTRPRGRRRRPAARHPPARARELLRGPRSPLRPPPGPARHPARPLHPLRPHRRRRALPPLHPQPQRRLLRAPRTPRRLRPLRRSQRRRPPRLAGHAGSDAVGGADGDEQVKTRRKGPHGPLPASPASSQAAPTPHAPHLISPLPGEGKREGPHGPSCWW